MTDDSLIVLAAIKDSMEEVACHTPFELGASNIDWLNQMYEAALLQLENTNGNSWQEEDSRSEEECKTVYGDMSRHFWEK